MRDSDVDPIRSTPQITPSPLLDDFGARLKAVPGPDKTREMPAIKLKPAREYVPMELATIRFMEVLPYGAPPGVEGITWTHPYSGRYIVPARGDTVFHDGTKFCVADREFRYIGEHLRSIVVLVVQV